MKRTKHLALGVVALALTTAGCSIAPDDSTTKASSSGGGKITVGFSVYDMQYEYFQKMEEGTKETVEAQGWGFKLRDEKSDEDVMVSGAEKLLDQGVDVLIISPFKPDALGPVVAKAKQLGVPVIIDDIGGGDTSYDAIVISDNEDGGAQAAEYMDAQIKANGSTSKKVVSITCEPSAVYAVRRNQGFDETIKSLGYDVVTELSGNSKPEDAYKITRDALVKDPDVAGVFACNDPMAGAATKAIRDAGKDPVKDIVTVGFNGDAEAVAAIQKGTLSATVAQDPSAMGVLTVDLAKDMFDGTPLPYDNPDTREVFEGVTLVTPDNVGGFAD